jgi:hypothetical protein
MAKQHLHEIGKLILLLFAMAWTSLFTASGLYWVLEKAGHPAFLLRDTGKPSLSQSLTWAGIFLVIFGTLWHFAAKPIGVWYYSRRARNPDDLALSPMKLPDGKTPQR